MNICKDSGTVRGLAIASLVLTIISLVICVAIIPFACSLSDTLSTNHSEFNVEVKHSMEQSVDDRDMEQLYEYFGAATEDELINDVAALVFGILAMVYVLAFAFNVVVLVGNILAIRNAEKPKSLMGAFVLSIVGAVCCFMLGAWIRCILLIVMAVYISKVRTWGKIQEATAAQQGNPPVSGNPSIPNVLQ